MKKVLLHFLNLAGSYILLDGHAILYGKAFFKKLNTVCRRSYNKLSHYIEDNKFCFFFFLNLSMKRGKKPIKEYPTKSGIFGGNVDTAKRKRL